MLLFREGSVCVYVCVCVCACIHVCVQGGGTGVNYRRMMKVKHV